MAKYICTCKETKELTKMTMVVIDDKVKIKEALCQCGEYMEEVNQEFGGFPSLIRTEPSLRKK